MVTKLCKIFDGLDGHSLTPWNDDLNDEDGTEKRSSHKNISEESLSEERSEPCPIHELMQQWATFSD